MCVCVYLRHFFLPFHSRTVTRQNLHPSNPKPRHYTCRFIARPKLADSTLIPRLFLAYSSLIPRLFLSPLFSQAKLAARRQRAEASSSTGSERQPPTGGEQTSAPSPPAPAACAASPTVAADQKAGGAAGYGRDIEEAKRFSSEKDENRNSLIKFLEGDAQTLNPKP